MATRKLTADEVRFFISVQQDEIPVRGNALASGDDAADRAAEDAILARLDSGDVWAWAHVTVTAVWTSGPAPSHRFAERSTLGGCSYRDEAEFCGPGGYFDDMKTDALDNLNKAIARYAEAIAPLQVSPGARYAVELTRTRVETVTIEIETMGTGADAIATARRRAREGLTGPWTSAEDRTAVTNCRLIPAPEDPEV
jgi:hypothetical protein